MDGDLISRCAVLEIIKKHECDTAGITTGVMELPVAYDIEKVCEKLWDTAEDIGQGGMLAHEVIDARDACEIVRSGGADKD